MRFFLNQHCVIKLGYTQYAAHVSPKELNFGGSQYVIRGLLRICQIVCPPTSQEEENAVLNIFNILHNPLHFRVPGYRSRGSGSIPGATRFSEKWWVWNGVHSAS
jgi:hypothetical protein